VSQYIKLAGLSDWNQLQTIILAQRRKDFEAGRQYVDFSDSGELISPPDFEDYLAK